MRKMITLLITVAMILTMAVPVFADEDIATAVTKPAKVQDVKVLKNGYRSLKITWQAEPVATKYQVYRATSKSGKYTLRKTTTATTYTNTGLICGKTYYYKVRAINAKGNGAFSVMKSSKVQPATVKITKVRPPKDDQVRVYWNKVSGATGYQVYRKRTDKTTWKLFKTVSNKYSYATDQLLGNATHPWGPGNGTVYDHKDMEHSWDYKVRAYRTVSGKKVYGYFSKPDKWIPDWTIEDIYEELWKYGESLKWTMYEWNGKSLVPKKDGSTYQLKHIMGWNENVEGEAGIVFTNPLNGNTAKNDSFIRHTPKNSNWGPLWPALINPYMTRASILKTVKEMMDAELSQITYSNPVFWDTDYDTWSGVQDFSIYHEKYLNGYKLWSLW